MAAFEDHIPPAYAALYAVQHELPRYDLGKFKYFFFFVPIFANLFIQTKKKREKILIKQKEQVKFLK